MRVRASQMKPVPAAPWITPKPLRESRVAILSTAGLHRRTDPPFIAGATDFRIIPEDVDWADMIMSHISTNFDRSAFQQDTNIWFPLDRLREMAKDGEIGSVADWHYSIMGAQPSLPALGPSGEEIGALLAKDEVDIALLIPV
tara:strand:- start:3418 stop:3846 length:429 start_codon:yes stop_codon:yes gene_type:complete